MLRTTWAKLLLFLSLPTLCFGQLNDLTDVTEYRHATYRLLGWDTTGTAFCDTTTMNQFVLRAVDQLPVWAYGEEKTKLVVTADGTENYYIDSLASQIVSVRKTDSSKWNTLKQIEPGLFSDVFERDSLEDATLYAPMAYHFWGDSLWLYPPPLDVDTLRVAYYLEPTVATGDSAITLDDKFQYGVVLWAAWQATRRAMGSSDQETQAAKQEYYEWANRINQFIVTKPRDVLKDERTARR